MFSRPASLVHFGDSARGLRAIACIVGGPEGGDAIASARVRPPNPPVLEDPSVLPSSSGGEALRSCGEVGSISALPSGWRVLDEVAPFTEADFDLVANGRQA